MKKHVFLTSLVAIGISCSAHAASDISFGGKYTQTDGTQANIADALAGVPYEYTKSDGTTATVADHNTDPSMTDFTYQDVDGSTKSLADGTPDISVYTGTTTASGDIASTQEVAAGKTASRDNYTYKNGAGEIVMLGESAQDMKETIALSSDYANGASVDVINGTAGEFSGALYTVEDGGYIYHLSEDGTKLVDDRNLDVTPTAGSALETKFNNMVLAYNTDKAAIETAKTTTADNKLLEDANFAAANTVFENDSAKITELDGFFATVGDATDAYAEAQAKQQVAKDAYAANDTVLQAAKDVYNASILETITNGANDAIDSALAQGGAIRSELDVNATAIADNKTAIETNATNITANSDAISAEKTRAETVEAELDGKIETNTANIATNATNIAVNKTAIETNATNIAANKTAIESEVARATAAEAELDGKIALNTAAIEEEVANRIAGDEMTLSAAKAYADAKNTMSLKSAYDYTDKKVDALEEELSAGIASAAAMSSVAVSNVAKGEVSVGGGYGYYNSQSAVALGAAMGLTDNWSVNAAAGLSDSNVTFRAGTNYKFKLF